jgi:pimeloyl-ACP methyl ester carboxylesterase
MATYVLVGGAWIGSWAWQPVTKELRAAGHEVYPLSLTGLAERVHLATPETDLDTHIADVTNLICFEDLDDVVLAGHSYAGAVITGAADRLSDRLSQVVFVDTAPFADGMSMLDLNSPDGVEQLRAEVRRAGDGWKLPFPGSEELAETADITGLTEEHLALMRRKAVPHPFRTWEQPLRLHHGGWATGGFERVMIACDEFRGLLDMNLPELAFIKAPDWRIENLETGHWPMLSVPQELAAVLMRG